jgi:hypothetical protein
MKLSLAITVSVALAGCGGGSGLAGSGGASKSGSKKDVSSPAAADPTTAGAATTLPADIGIDTAAPSAEITGAFLVGCDLAPEEQATLGQGATSMLVYGCAVHSDKDKKKVSTFKIDKIALKGSSESIAFKAAPDASPWQVVLGVPGDTAVTGFDISYSDLSGGHAVVAAAATFPACGAHGFLNPLTATCETALPLIETVQLEPTNNYHYRTYELGKDAASTGIIAFLLPPDAPCTQTTAADTQKCLRDEDRKDGTVNLYQIQYADQPGQPDYFIYGTGKLAADALDGLDSPTLRRSLGRLRAHGLIGKDTCRFASALPTHTRFALATNGTPAPPDVQAGQGTTWSCDASLSGWSF